MKKIIIIILTILVSATLFLMIQDYIKRPPIMGDGSLQYKMSNEQGSIYRFSLFVIFEFLFVLIYIKYIDKIKIVYKIGVSLLFSLFCSVSIALTIEASGVEAIHALWTTSLLLLTIVLIFLNQK